MWTRFGDIVGMIEGAHMFLTRSFNVASLMAPEKKDRTPLPFHNNPLLPMEQVCQKIAQADKEYSIALFPEYKSLYEL